MHYPTPTARLPVVRYPPAVSMPGASHAARPGGGRPFPLRRALAVTSLLAALASVATLHPAPPAPVRPPVLRARPVPVPARAAPWDARLDAVPRRGQFLRFFRMRATAYAPINTRLEGGRYTSTRLDGRAAHGVAVDPAIIPLGSRLWIPGYGHAVADDVGGAIRGHHLDVRMQVPEHMGVWGVRSVRVYVLQEPGR